MGDNMNNKGFTLIELLAIVVLLCLITSVGTYAVVNYINKAREKSDNILISNIETASQEYLDECSSGLSSIDKCQYTKSSDSNSQIISRDITLNDLVSNNFLTISSTEKNNQETNILKNSKGDEINDCQYTITKTKTEKYQITYTVTSNNNNKEKCPSINYDSSKN